MTDFKVWGSTLVVVAVVVGCGETSNFVGTGPAGGNGGTASGGNATGGNATGGNATGGSSSKAGSSSSAGKSASAGSDAGGSGSGGDVAAGGTSAGGSVATGGSGMGGGDPTGDCTKRSGNWLSCKGGLHRTEPGKCQSKLPRAGAIPPTKPDLDECTKDSECTAKPNGFCDVLPSGFVPVEPHNICAYGCLQDSDCSDGAVCLCGDFIGSCETAPSCKSDEDCTGGALCTQYDSCPGVPVSSFACQTPNDQCQTNVDCVEASKRFCSISGNDGSRACVGVRCAAAAAGP
jgi:hypothetical protein